jgi:EmrB/QacA subfamily drug resistance transporter
MNGFVIEDRSRQRLIVISVAFSAFMAALDTYIVNVALPTIAHYFNAGTNDAALITLSYLLIITSTLPIFGKVGDRAGFKPVFIAGFILFTLGSLLSGFAPHIYLLVGCRCIQGMGAAMLYAVGMAMVARHIPAESRGWAFGITATMAGLGVVVGAPLGGIITQFFSWHWIFWINVPVGIAAIIMALKVMPDDRVKASPGARMIPFDVTGAVLIFLSLTLLVMGINRGQQFGWAHWGILAMFALSAILFTWFILQERKCADPLLKLSLFNQSSFAFGAFACMAGWALFSGSNFLLPFYMSLTWHLSTSVIGAMFLISSVVYIITSPLMGKLSDRTGAKILCWTGALSLTASVIFFTFTLSITSLVPLVIYLAWIGLSFGSFVPADNSLTLGGVPVENQGAASAASRTLQNLGMVLGVAVFETAFSGALPHSALNTSLAAAALPSDQLFSGFRNAFLAGVIMCLICLGFSLLAKENRIPANHKGTLQMPL